MPESDTDRPRPRIVLLGASNVARTIDVAIDIARFIFESPIEILAADGRGRSYGQPTKLLGRSLSSILDCGLWQAIERAGPAPTYAVVTDIGNDIIYGSDSPVILRWISEAVDRLRAMDAHVIITGLPLERIERIGPREFRIFLRLLYPSHTLTLEHGKAEARRIDIELRELSRQHDAIYAPQPSEWYGVDPVHIQHAKAREAWDAIMRRWPGIDAQDPSRPRPLPCRSWRRYAWMTLLPPEERWWFGGRIKRHHDQPVGRLGDGTRIWLY